MKNSKVNTINVLFVLAALFTSKATIAEVYYVSENGDDSATGLDRNNAWKRIITAAKKVLPGDTVIVGTGTYEQLTVLNSGEPDKPITFRGDATTDRPRVTNGINIGSDSWIVVENFDVPPGLGGGVTIKEGHNNVVRSFSVDGHWRGVNINNGNNNLIEDFSVTGAREGVYIYNNASNNVIRDCSVRHNGNAPEYTTGDRHGIAVGGAGICIGNIVERCEVAYSGGAEHSPALIAMFAPNTVFRGNNVHHNYGDGLMIAIGSPNSIVEANNIEANGQQAVENGERGLRALAIAGTEYVTTEDNVLTGNYVSPGLPWSPSDTTPAGVLDCRQAGPVRVNLRTNTIKGNVFSDNIGGPDIFGECGSLLPVVENLRIQVIN